MQGGNGGRANEVRGEGEGGANYVTVSGLPDYMKNHPVYYAGPAKTPTGYASGSFGPTTAGTWREQSSRAAE